MAERELRIRVTVDTSQGDRDLDAFWAREAQRQQAAAQARSGGAGGGMGGGQAGGPAPAPMAQAGVLPGNMPGPMPMGQIGAGAAGGGVLPGMMVPAPPQGAGAQLGGAGGAGGRAALPPPPGAPALVPVGPPGPGGWQVMAPGGGGGAAPPPGGGIPVNPRPAPGQGPPAGGGQGRAQGLVVGAAALGAAKGLNDARLGSEREATEYSQDVAAEAAAERARNREIAALREMPNTGATAAMMAREAAQAGISPDQWRSFQAGFQAYGGQYVGEGRKFEASQAQELQRIVAGYAVGSRGWSGSDASRLLATVMSKAKKGASNEDILGQFGQMAQVMQLAPGYTGPLLGQLSEVVGESVGEGAEFDDPLAAAVLLRGESERNPRTASAYTRAVLRGLRRARSSPKKAAELGIKKGMNPFEELEAVNRAAQAAAAKGQDENTFLEQHGFKEIRQFGGIRAALTYGVRGGAFDRARAEAGDRGAMAGRVRAEADEYRRGEEGSAAGDAAAIAAARLEQGAKGDEWARIQRRAAVAVESSGDLERGEGPVKGFMTMMTSPFFGGRREQETHAEATRQLEMSLGNSAAGRKYLHTYDPKLGGTPGNYLATHRRGGEDAVFKEIANTLKSIRAEAQKQTRLLERERAVRAGVPIGGGALGAAAAITVRQPGAGDGRQSPSGVGQW